MYVWALVRHSLHRLMYRSRTTMMLLKKMKRKMMVPTAVLLHRLQGLMRVKPYTHTISSALPLSSCLPATIAWGRSCVLASMANFLNIWIDMKRCSFHLIPVYVMVRAPQNAKHRKHCKFLSLFISVFLSLVTVKLILMTMALRTGCPILKVSVWKSCCMVQRLPVGRGRVWLAGDIVTRPSGLHQKERDSFCHSPRRPGSKWHHSFPEVAPFTLPPLHFSAVPWAWTLEQ